MKKRTADIKKFISKISVAFVAITLVFSMLPAAAYAAGEDAAVDKVIEQLEAIDTLQQMQNKRYDYKVKTRYDVGETKESIITEHETARNGYETYVSMMFAQRLAAKEAYEALSDEQKAQIDASLVAKLSEDLPTDFKPGTYDVTPADDEYIYEAVYGGFGYIYEASNHMIFTDKPNIAQTFILVDTSDGKTSWTPNGKYEYGKSNYDVLYCCDAKVELEYTKDYKRVNLEDSQYYGEESAKHIRAILQNSYPYVSVSEMKDNLKAGGLEAEFVDSLTREDMIAGVQMAIWSYSNINDKAKDGLRYISSASIYKNIGTYFTPLHDYTNECWDWHPGLRMRSYDARAEYRVNNLAYYLCSLPGVEAEEEEIIISDIQVTRADLIEESGDTYTVGMYVLLNGSGNKGDNLKVTVKSINEDGTVADMTGRRVDGKTEHEMSVKAKAGQTIEVSVEGTQTHSKGVYFYEPEGGRDVSQCLVGVAEGKTEVNTTKSFVFQQDITKGLRIYKTATGTKMPISDITFDVYKVDGEAVSAVPTDEEVQKIAKDSNKVGSVVTDETGYASISLEDGVYMVVEQHNADKVEAPVAPFCIQLPMDGEDIAAVYPKNEPVDEPDEPIIIPTAPDNVKGTFTILKHDADDKEKVLEGAEFKLYRPATSADTNTKTIICNAKEYSVVKVDIDKLVTGEDGKVTSPELPCGVYFLEEVKAPDEYYLLDQAVMVTVKSSLVDEVNVVEIANRHGAVLPQTGGIGTTIFRIAGALLILCAASLLIRRRVRRYHYE